MGRGQRVGVKLARTEALLIALLAVLKTGAAYVPIDPSYPAERIAYLTDKTKPDANTQGKVVDSQFGVRASKKVAGAGRKAPRGQHGRAKQKQSRAKRANAKIRSARDGAPGEGSAS